VSRGLVYRYFPAKRDLFAAVFRRAGDRLLAVSLLDAAAPAADQVLAGLDAHLDYFAANRNTVLAANRGALAGDPAVQEIISGELAVLRDRLLAAAGVDEAARAVTAVALHGWLALVRDVCLEWLQHGTISREQVRDLCFRALAGLVELPG
jgi:AcrR family transcriptional regulator